MAKAGWQRFLRNVVWNWTAVVVNLFAALILTPYVIRRLGDDDFGVWALTTSLAEYYWILDFGFRSATVKYTAQYATTGEKDKINELLNTALFYSACVAPLILVTTFLLAPHLGQWMHVTHPLFPKLIMIVITGWVLGAFFNVFIGVLEGLQRFDLTNQISFIALAVRAFGTAFLLWLGYGVLAVAGMVFAAQMLSQLVSLLTFRRVFPEAVFSLRYARLPVLRMMLSYGQHSALASIAQRVLNQGAPMVIGTSLPTRFVGYYTAPSRMLDYIVDGFTRVGMVSSPSAAEMTAAGQRERLVGMSVNVNRYCLLFFLPLAVFLAVYGREVLAAWIRRPQFADNAVGVLFAMLLGVTLVSAGQYNSIAILFGMGKHKTYARALGLEAAASLLSMIVIVPRYGIVGAAWTATAFMLLNRGAFTAWLLSSELEISYAWFLSQIYQPLWIAVPGLGTLLLLRHYGLAGANWGELILAGTILMLVYTPLAFFSVRPQHRVLLWNSIRQRLSFRAVVEKSS